MFIFQQQAAFSSTAKVEITTAALENSLKNKEVQALLSNNNINTSALSPLQAATAIVSLMQKDANFSKEWQSLTTLDLKSMETILAEYRRIEELNSKFLEDANKRIGDTAKQSVRVSEKSTRFSQGEKTDSDKRAALLLKQFGKIRKVEPDTT